MASKLDGAMVAKDSDAKGSAIEPSQGVRREWARRIEAEYRSSAHTQHLTLWLIQLGAPRELIDDGLRIVADELDHAELAATVCAAAGGAPQSVLAREQLALPNLPGPLERSSLSVCLEVFCLGETVAVPLFTELRRECTVPSARAALDRILKDEVRHRQFGWDLLDYLLDTYPEEAASAPVLLAPAIARMAQRYGRLDSTEVTQAERAWGLMAPASYKTILQQTVEREFRPRFAERSIPFSPASTARESDRS